MASDVLQTLWIASLATTAALVLVLLVRAPLRRLGGAAVLRWPWAATVLAPLATLLPAPMAPTLAVEATSFRMLAATPWQGTVSAASAASPWPDTVTLVLTLWLAGMCASALVCAWQQRRFVRGLGTLRRYDDGLWRASTSAGTPAVLGVLSPRIVLPADFEQRFTPAERELALAHEHAHRRAHDTQIAAVATALRCVFWFHPLVHVAVRCLRLDQEYACDAAVLAAHPRRARTYAEALLKTQVSLMLPVGCQWDAGLPLLARMRQLGVALPNGRRRALARTAAVLTALLATTAAWALQPATPADASTPWVEARIELRATADVGLPTPTAAEPSRLIVRDGQPFSLRMDVPGTIWELTGVPHLGADDRIHLDVQLLRGGQLVMSSSDEHQPDQPLHLRSGHMEDGIGATATISLRPVLDPSAPGDQRATGRVRVSRAGGEGETQFFDVPLGGQRDAVMPPDVPLHLRYRVEILTPEEAFVILDIDHRKADGTIVNVWSRLIQMDRGTPATLHFAPSADVAVDRLGPWTEDAIAVAAYPLDIVVEFDPG